MNGKEGKCPVDHKLLAEQHKAQPMQTNGGSCPVDHSKLSANGHTASEDQKSSSKAAAGKCPIDHSKMQPGKQEQGKCPVDHSAMGAIPGGLKEGGQPPKAVCPFGFGSSDSNGPSMTSLHCPKCKALFFDCVKSNCGHAFCRDCIVAGKECLSCGDQITELHPNPDVQELVDTFVATHSSDPKFVADRKAAGKDQDPDATKAEFLLETALQSFAGGNSRAALFRLQLCKEQLLKMNHGKQPNPEIAVQLGAVCGSQGDCEMQLGDAEKASTSYQESIAYLESSPSRTIEVEKALTVTQNKLGDLAYRTGNLQQARSQYLKALKSRQALAAGCSGAEKQTADLDVAFSLAKAADIEQALKNGKEAVDYLGGAQKLAETLTSEKDNLEAPAKKRLDLLNAFLGK